MLLAKDAAAGMQKMKSLMVEYSRRDVVDDQGYKVCMGINLARDDKHARKGSLHILGQAFEEKLYGN